MKTKLFLPIIFALVAIVCLPSCQEEEGILPINIGLQDGFSLPKMERDTLFSGMFYATAKEDDLESQTGDETLSSEPMACHLGQVVNGAFTGGRQQSFLRVENFTLSIGAKAEIFIYTDGGLLLAQPSGDTLARVQSGLEILAKDIQSLLYKRGYRNAMVFLFVKPWTYEDKYAYPVSILVKGVPESVSLQCKFWIKAGSIQRHNYLNTAADPAYCNYYMVEKPDAIAPEKALPTKVGKPD